ncbi:hypothetical protein INR77_00275 [Erythrobacter sp. SCSIO 43205]|uniref:hypothetical protein n=1 Tax=Erythrobacter sp. SCSIO 43205 TaxID=2779361 RepID=UPI001CA9EA96|nr:hypothetical protein [Erythrobacter sp. SCSIO 43205]UAB78230.1 hypothetical protein INR77_00275 [Erythrobacter sp. SCSIO 43205]
MITRIIWFAALLVVAGVCIGVQLDRQSRKDPELAQYVPEPFRSSAQRVLTASAVNAGKPEAGLAEARKLVERRPLPAEHLRLLTQAQVAADDAEAGTITIQYAAQRGWRDPYVQLAMVQIALEVGDEAQSARRYAALFMIRGTQEELLEQLGAQVLAEPGGEARAVLAEIVSGADRWHSIFLQRGARVMPPDAFVEIVTLSAGEGVRFDCRRLEQAARSLASRDASAGEALTALIARQC